MGLLAVWEALVDSGVAPVVLYGRPIGIAAKFVALLADGTLLRDCWVTFEEALIGFVIGSLAGTAAGLLLWLSPTAPRRCSGRWWWR